jgi:hypothetical protein
MKGAQLVTGRESIGCSPVASTGTRAHDQVRTRARSRLLDGAPVQAGTPRDGRRYPNSAGVDPHSARVAPVGRVSVSTLLARGRPARPRGASRASQSLVRRRLDHIGTVEKKKPRRHVSPGLGLLGVDRGGKGELRGATPSWLRRTTPEWRRGSRTRRNAPATVGVATLARARK